jgi:pyridoxamine 5'-phosphate oxidase family protein
LFTEKEFAYLQSQPLARLATVGPDGQPDNSAVGFRFDGTTIVIGGMAMAKTRKYKNVASGNNKIAIVVDDLESVDPWKPRGIRIFGTAEALDQGGPFGDGHQLRITPTISWSWNVEGPAMVDGRFIPHRTVHVKDEG